jgi:hypothetical protein
LYLTAIAALLPVVSLGASGKPITGDLSAPRAARAQALPISPLSGGAIVAGALMIAAAAVAARARRRAARPRGDRREGRRVLIVSRKPTTIRCGGAKSPKPLDRCFEEVGFRTYQVSSLSGLSRRLVSVAPHVVAVDVGIDAHAVSKVERILRRKGSWSTIPVVFYNVEGVPPSKARPAVGLLRNAWNLGPRFSDRELFEVVAPVVKGEGGGRRPGTTTMQAATNALQGRIIDDSLQEVLTFMEIGRKTGCLLVETRRPFGMIFFDRGTIVNAATKDREDMEAVLEMLKIRRGIFRFAPGKQPAEITCALPASGVLLEFNKRLDEAMEKAGSGRPVDFYITPERAETTAHG